MRTSTPSSARSPRAPAILAKAWLAAGLLATTAAAAEPWTAERVLAAARLRDPAVRAARARGEAERARAAISWTMLSPRVSLSANFTRTDDPALLFSQKLWQGKFTPADFAIDRLNQPDPESALQLTLMVDQPLWNGGREWTAPGLAGRRARAATAMERAAVSDRLLGAVEAWVGAVAARQRALAAKLSLDAASAMRTAAVERFRMGQVPELDTLRAAARESESRVQAIGAEREVAVTLARLSRLVGEPVTEDQLATAGEPPAVPAAAGGRGEQVAASEAAAAAATESRTAGLRLLPTLSSRFLVSQYRPAEAGDFERRWMVALSAELPLFDGAERWNEWRAARAGARQARAEAEAMARDLAVGLDAARAEDAVAAERRAAAALGRAAAEEALRLATHRYRSGLLPFTDLLAADAEASAARGAEVETAAAVQLARYRLLHAMGELR